MDVGVHTGQGASFGAHAGVRAMPDTLVSCVSKGPRTATSGRTLKSSLSQVTSTWTAL